MWTNSQPLGLGVRGGVDPVRGDRELGESLVEQGAELLRQLRPVVGDGESGALVAEGAELLVALLELDGEARPLPHHRTDAGHAG